MAPRIVLSLAIACIALAPVAAGADCRIADPTGTPLNVRTAPNGRIVGRLDNGQAVSILAQTMSDGKEWAYLGDARLNDQPIGWVFAEYVACGRSR